ncbi:MAG TPA: hypothetical protein VIF15_00350 [Polyangiaceae bacterium]
MAGVAQDGIYSLWQEGAQVGQLVAQAGKEYWWLYPAYRYPRLEALPDVPGFVVVSYKLESVDLSAFDASNPTAPLAGAPAASTLVTASATPDSAGRDYPFVIVKRHHLTLQVDPMMRPGFIGIFTGTVDPKAPPLASLIGRVVSLLKKAPPESRLPNPPPLPSIAEEHWFLSPGKSLYPTTVGAITTISFLGVIVDPTPPWWTLPRVTVPPEKPVPATFHSGAFEAAVGPKGHHVYVECDYQPGTLVRSAAPASAP